MKRLLSVLLALVMVMSLAGVMGVSALAAEDELTIVLTGGTDTAVGGEGLGFATAAAIKDTYDSNAVLLVDAGGFDAAAGAIMTAAGYDLVVPDEVMGDWAVTSIAMNSDALKPGALIEKNGVKVGFVAVEPMGGMDAATYYDTIQGAVTGARDTGAEFVIALGRVDDANAIIENVSGIDAILTYGATAIKALPGEITEEAEQTEEPAEETEETDGETEDAAEVTEEGEEELTQDGETEEPAAQALYVSVGSDFGSIGIVSIKGNMLYAETVNEETVGALELEESSAIQALEAAFQPAHAQEETVEETTEESEIAEEPEAAEETEDAEETEAAEEQPAEDGATADAEPVKEDAVEEPTDTETSDEETAEDAADAETAEEEQTNTDGEAEAADEPAAVEPTPVADGASATDAQETENTDALPEESAKPAESDASEAGENDASEEPAAPAETEQPADNADNDSNAPTEFIRGLADLEIDFENPVKEVEIKDGSDYKEFESRYYTLSNGDKTVALSASVLNDWPDGNYWFRFLFADGTEAEIVVVRISGDKPVPDSEEQSPAKETTPAAEKETSKADPTPAPAKDSSAKKASTPATGDTSPIGVYAAILGVMVVALAIVIVLVVRKKKTQDK